MHRLEVKYQKGCKIIKKLTHHLFLFCLIAFLYSFYYILPTSVNPWDKWDATTITRANTAAGLDYLTEEERQVILLTNLARIDGPRFTSSFLNTYQKNKKPTRYSRSLVRDLRKVKGLQPLNPEQDLYEVALGHAIESGKTGHTGHRNFDRRFKPLLGKYNRVAENCAYGFDKAMDIVIQLLIDENISNLGHRKNILSPEYNSTGVSIQPHKTYKYNCVIGYGKKVK